MKRIRFIVQVIAFIFLVQLLFFYRGIYIPSPLNEPDYLNINVNVSIPIETNDSFSHGNGIVLIDLSHGNRFIADDLNLLFSRIIARGYNLEYLRDSSNLKKNLSFSTSFVEISPASTFSKEEVESVKEFTDGGGRLLMLSEPIHKSEINSLASEFGILFWNDYLYNLKENDGNFRYIYLKEFSENNITRGLHKIVFYTSSSVFGKGIIFTDNNTYSSTKGEKGRYSVAALTENSRILAIGDVTFLSEPYNVMDNNRLIYNIADFLAPSAAAPAITITIGTNNSNVTSMRNVTATDIK
ncbi:MAG: hypothetical protein ABIH80_05920 [Methanobacteriota archaeon]